MVVRTRSNRIRMPEKMTLERFGEDSDDKDEMMMMLKFDSKEIRDLISRPHDFLKVVELIGFTGRPNIVNLFHCLLEIATSLNEIIIDASNPFCLEEDTEAAITYARLRAHVPEKINLVVH